MKDMCRIVTEPLRVLDLSRYEADQLYDEFDRQRCRYIRETGLCQKVNGELCQMTDEHQREFVEVFIDNDDYSEDED